MMRPLQDLGETGGPTGTSLARSLTCSRERNACTRAASNDRWYWGPRAGQLQTRRAARAGGRRGGEEKGGRTRARRESAESQGLATQPPVINMKGALSATATAAPAAATPAPAPASPPRNTANLLAVVGPVPTWQLLRSGKKRLSKNRNELIADVCDA